MKSNPDTLSPFKRIWNLVGTEKRNIRFLYIYAILAGAISLIIPLGIQAIIGLVLAGKLSSSWFILIVLITLAILLSGLTGLAQLSILESIQSKLFVRTAFDFSEKLASASRYLRKYTSFVELSEKFLDVITVQKSFSKLLLSFTSSLLEIIFGIVLLAIYHPSFLIFGFSLLILVAFILRTTYTRGVESARNESNYKFKTAFWLTEIAQNRVTFNLKQEQNFHLKKTDEYLKGYVSSRQAHFRVLYNQAAIAIGMKVVLTMAMLFLGSFLLVRQDISLGQFLASEILIISLVDAVGKLVISVESVYDAGIAMEKLGSVTDAVLDERVEHTSYTSIPAEPPSVTLVDKKSGKPVIEIQAGQKIGICGLPGTGRTRILKTIIGDLETQYASQLNNVPVENISGEGLGSITGICLQGSNIFEGTLAQNIVLGNEPDLTELTSLSKTLNLHSFVSSLPGGFNYEFESESGIPNNIARKIPLARALYHTPPLILIDDVWGVFTKKELEAIWKHINNIKSTVIFISNQIPVLSQADSCLFLDEQGLSSMGKINENNVPSVIQDITWH
ncbi:MAG: ABC transporter ATP-binding protein [Bacteroidetes bacterium]|jgi:ABC-type bacteriocin/lantibiotic exporter with double-glycine peptidase domain|nr:ABC transporter ATP-binding protein [Bacteroidota bacterium]